MRAGQRSELVQIQRPADGAILLDEDATAAV